MSKETNSRKGAAKLWTVQGLLAAMFLLAGGMKWAMPIAMLEAQSHLPGAFVRFIGVCEVLGALGLILPGLFRVRTDLTFLAAVGLVLIMTGATTITVGQGQILPAIGPLVLGLLAAFVARGRVPAAQPAVIARPTILQRAA
jgi:DoxX-like family